MGLKKRWLRLSPESTFHTNATANIRTVAAVAPTGVLCPSPRSARLGFFQQRYVKRHAIYHEPDIHNEIRLFAAPKIRPPSGLQFWGLDSDRILELSAREIASAQQVNMPPGHNLSLCDTLE